MSNDIKVPSVPAAEIIAVIQSLTVEEIVCSIKSNVSSTNDPQTLLNYLMSGSRMLAIKLSS